MSASLKFTIFLSYHNDITLTQKLVLTTFGQVNNPFPKQPLNEVKGETQVYCQVTRKSFLTESKLCHSKPELCHAKCSNFAQHKLAFRAR